MPAWAWDHLIARALSHYSRQCRPLYAQGVGFLDQAKFHQYYQFLRPAPECFSVGHISAPKRIITRPAAIGAYSHRALSSRENRTWNRRIGKKENPVPYRMGRAGPPANENCRKDKAAKPRVCRMESRTPSFGTDSPGTAHDLAAVGVHQYPVETRQREYRPADSFRISMPSEERCTPAGGRFLCWRAKNNKKKIKQNVSRSR